MLRLVYLYCDCGCDILISIITGDLGAYKTALAVDWALDAMRSGYPVYANLSLGVKDKAGLDGVVVSPFEGFNRCRLSQLLNLEITNSFVLGDEIYTEAESRTSASKVNRVVTYVGFQSRKMQIDWVLTAQLESSIDLRLVALCDLFVVASYNYELDRPEYTFIRAGRKPVVERKWIAKEYFVQNVFPYYQSFEKVNPLSMKDLVAEMDRYDTKAFNELLDVMCDMFQKKYDVYGIRTEQDLRDYLVKDWLYETGESITLLAAIVARLKSRLRKQIVGYRQAL